MEKVVSLCKRRGFVFPSSEIYGGINALYDYGPYGVALRRNIRNLWWRHVVELRDDVVGLEASIIMNPRIWVASGPVGARACRTEGARPRRAPARRAEPPRSNARKVSRRRPRRAGLPSGASR